MCWDPQRTDPQAASLRLWGEKPGAVFLGLCSRQPRLPNAVARTTLASGPQRNASGTSLNEASDGEIAVESQSVTHPEAPHQRKAGCVDEGIRPFVVSPEPSPCVGLEIFVGVANGERGQRRYGVTKLHRSVVSGAPAQKSPCLAHHVVARDKRPRPLLPQGAGRRMTLVSPESERNPKRGVDEPQAP